MMFHDVPWTASPTATIQAVKPSKKVDTGYQKMAVADLVLAHWSIVCLEDETPGQVPVA